MGLLPVIAAFAAVCGHIWPVYLRFRGGKGIATAAGAILALNPLSVAGAALVWIAVFETWRYVSLASILAAVSLPLFSLFFKVSGCFDASIPMLCLFFLLGALTIVKHRTNIRRLMDGTENRFERKKKTSSDAGNPPSGTPG